MLLKPVLHCGLKDDPAGLIGGIQGELEDGMDELTRMSSRQGRLGGGGSNAEASVKAQT